jgi:hypothetical protein
MKTWTTAGYKVFEEAFDYDLHCFRVVTDNKEDQYIYPQTFDDMDLLIDALDRGLDINGFENGFGETITT